MTITDFTIGGADRKSAVNLESLSINLVGDGGGSTCEFEIPGSRIGSAYVGEAKVGSFNIGDGIELLQEVKIKSGTNVIFGGEITVIRVRVERGVRIFTVVARDWQPLLDDRTTDLAVYSQMYDGDIVSDIISRFAPGVTVSRADKIVFIDRIDLSNKQVTEAIRTLAKLSSAEWNLDGDKNFFYFDPLSMDVLLKFSDAPDNTNTFPVSIRSELERDATALANDVTVANKASVETVKTSFTSTTSGDDGYVERTGTTWPPTGSFTTDTTATIVRAARTRVNTQTFTNTFAASGGPWSLTRTQARAWPPAPPATQGTSNVVEESATFVDLSIDLSQKYTQRRVLYQLDTSTIPSDAVIKSSTLNINVGTVQWDGASSVYLGAERVDFTPPPNDNQWVTIPPSWHLFSISSGSVIQISGFPVNRAAVTGVEIGLTSYMSPLGVNSVDISSVTVTVTYEATATSYNSTVGLMSWDTSTIPDAARVLAATAKLKVSSVSTTLADSPTLRWESYAGSNWPIDTADWTSTAAGASTSLQSIAAGSVIALPLATTAVSTTGRTGIRLHVDTGGAAPTGTNKIEVVSADAAADRPVLDVEYADLANYFSANVSDSDSIARFGRRAIKIIDSRITSQTEAQTRAQMILAQGKDPAVRLRASWTKDGAVRGGRVFMSLTPLGLEAAMIVRRLRMRWLTPSLTEYEADLGEIRPDLIRLLRSVVNQIGG